MDFVQVVHAILLSYGECDGEFNFVDYVDDDEWIGNQHVDIGWGREVVRGKKM